MTQPTITVTVHTDARIVNCSRCGDGICAPEVVRVETDCGDVEFDEYVCGPCLTRKEWDKVAPQLRGTLGGDFRTPVQFR